MGACHSVDDDKYEQAKSNQSSPKKKKLETNGTTEQSNQIALSSHKEVQQKEPQKEPAKPLTTEEKFETIRVLGEGASCRVLAVRDRANGKAYAMKVLNKQPATNKFLFDNEVSILQTLKHRYILELVESYEDKSTLTYHILTKLYEGGELFDRVKHGSFSEKVASKLTQQMVEAVAHCHKNNIIHRDIKPENFVFEDKKDDSTMRLIDFGVAQRVTDEQIVHDVAGSPYYVAPEVLMKYTRTGKTWKASDMWSVGVIIFLFVCGYPPFNGDTQEKIFRNIIKSKYRIASDVHLSQAVKDLIEKLLVKDPTQRITAEDVLKHPWVSGQAAPDQIFPEGVCRSITEFRTHCRLKKAVGRVLGDRMTSADRDFLASIFKQYDKNGDGQLGVKEIIDMMKNIGYTQSDAQRWIDELDEDGDGQISEKEFAAAAALVRMSSNEEYKTTFDMFDADHDGFVTMKEIEKVCNLSHEEAQKLIKEVDVNGDGQVSLDEWIHAMKSSDRQNLTLDILRKSKGKSKHHHSKTNSTTIPHPNSTTTTTTTTTTSSTSTSTSLSSSTTTTNSTSTTHLNLNSNSNLTLTSTGT